MQGLTKHLTVLDWSIIAIYFVFVFGLAIYHSRRANKGMDDYFVSGRKASWWLLGTSMVATTFAADTPLAVSGMVVRNGIAWNWYWWGLAMATLMGVFFFSRLWRRSGVLTDNELIELRYEGGSAAFLRAFRGIYFAIIYNCIVIGWVNLAMVKILGLTLDFDKNQALWICMSFALVYTLMSGLTGVMATDVMQFAIAMFGAIYLAVVAVIDIGGLGAIHDGLITTYGANKAAEISSLFPAYSSQYSVGMFWPVMIFIFFQWWTASNSDSGGYLAQRMLSAKDEKHSFLGMLWFNIAHYCLRPWPWIMVGLCAAILFPYIPDAAGVYPDPELGYVKVMLKYLPVGMLGLVLASFFAAYMSTIDTHLNWGASYMVNDIYKRFIKKEASDRHYIVASWVATVLIAVCGAGVTMMMDSIADAWYVVSAIYGGLAIVYILRWFWWRINAWSEIGAMTAALSMTYVVRGIFKVPYPLALIYIVPVALTVAFAATFLTKPVSKEKLTAFYRKVRPGGPGWRLISKDIPGADKDPGPAQSVFAYVVSIAAVYCALFGIGKLLLGPASRGLLLIGIAIALGGVLWKYISSQNWQGYGSE
ncbi:MAG TPA: Na+:solute symporter [bacterium]|nr:Na+:solute symporter [bacterium]